MNKVYRKAKYSATSNLGDAETEFLECVKQQKLIDELFNANLASTNKETIDKFVNRSFKLSKELPGAIGNYIGFKIAEKYTQKYGSSSWKDIFMLSPSEVLKKVL